MNDHRLLDLARTCCAWIQATTSRFARDDRGEGVISTAIAVLVMAFLGALMWVAFRAIWDNAASRTSTQVGSIGR
jgi:hypothetical protein